MQTSLKLLKTRDYFEYIVYNQCFKIILRFLSSPVGKYFLFFLQVFAIYKREKDSLVEQAMFCKFTASSS